MQPHISIHALREEGDGSTVCGILGVQRFLSTPSARRATRSRPLEHGSNMVFLSTPSARRATWVCRSGSRQSLISIHALREEGDLIMRVEQKYDQHFYPRPPRGGRHRSSVLDQPFPIISIHALREEGDWLSGCFHPPCLHFYPRPPRGGRPPLC